MGQTPGEIRRDIEHTRESMSATLDAIGYKLDVGARVHYRWSTTKDSLTHLLHGDGDGDGNGSGHEQTMLDTVQKRVVDTMDTVGDRVAGFAHSTWDKAMTTEDRVMATAGETGGMLSGVMTNLETGFSHIKESVMEGVTSQAGATLETAKTQGRALGARAKDNALSLGIGAFAIALVGGLFLPKTKIEEEKIQPFASKVTHQAVAAGEEALQKGEDMAGEALHNLTQQDQPKEEIAPQQFQQPKPEPAPSMAG